MGVRIKRGSGKYAFKLRCYCDEALYVQQHKNIANRQEDFFKTSVLEHVTKNSCTETNKQGVLIRVGGGLEKFSKIH